jgi:hypothetical protein
VDRDRGGGLSRLKQGRFCNLASREGLPDDVISQLLEDDFGHLWIGSNRGICRVRKSEIDEFAAGRLAQITAVAYGRSEGMLSLECTGGFHPAGLKTKDGRLWFSTVQGVVMVDPRRLILNPRPPPVVIEALRIDGRMSPISNSASLPGPSVAATRRFSSASNGAGLIKVAHGTETLEFIYTPSVLLRRKKCASNTACTDLTVIGGRRRAAQRPATPGCRLRLPVSSDCLQQ